MSNPEVSVGIIYGRFLKIYIIPITLLLLIMKLVFGTNMWIASAFAAWDFIVLNVLFFIVHFIFTKRFSERKAGLSHLYPKIESRVSLPYNSACSAAFEAANKLKGYRLLAVNNDIGVFYGITGPTSTSLGEIVIVKIDKLDNEKSNIAVSSHPAFNGGFADNGRNYGNVKLIIASLNLELTKNGNV